MSSVTVETGASVGIEVVTAMLDVTTSEFSRSEVAVGTAGISEKLGKISGGRFVGKKPVGQIPVGKAPVGKKPVGTIAGGAPSVGKMPVGKTPAGRSVRSGKGKPGRSVGKAGESGKPSGWPCGRR